MGVESISFLLPIIPFCKGGRFGGEWEGVNMQELFIEALFVAVLILVNGYLAGTEIAVVTARKSNIKRLAESGKQECEGISKTERRARPVSGYDPDRITGVGVLASAVGGAAAIKAIKLPFRRFPSSPFPCR